MKQKIVDKLIGKYCKIVTKEPGEDKSNVLFGYVDDVDHDLGFIIIKTGDGIGCISLDTIVAIKPRKFKK